MTVAEIKAKLPEAEVHELRPDAKYLVLLDLRTVPRIQMGMLDDLLSSLGLSAVCMLVEDPHGSVRILEAKEG